MKRTVIILSIIAGFLLFNASSCNDDGGGGFTKIKVIEGQIYNEIKSFRLDNGISDDIPFVHQVLMVKEAQIISTEIGFGTLSFDSASLAPHWENLYNLGGTNDATLFQQTPANMTAADIVANWTSDSASRAILLEDYTQCGAGVTTLGDSAYVTVMLMLVED